MSASSSTKGLSAEQRSETPELLPSYLARIARGELLWSREEIELTRGARAGYAQRIREARERLEEGTQGGAETRSRLPARMNAGLCR